MKEEFKEQFSGFIANVITCVIIFYTFKLAGILEGDLLIAVMILVYLILATEDRLMREIKKRS